MNLKIELLKGRVYCGKEDKYWLGFFFPTYISIFDNLSNTGPVFLMLQRKRYHHIMCRRTASVNGSLFNGRKQIKQHARWNCLTLGKYVHRWALDLGAPRNSRLLPALPRSEKQQPVPKTHQNHATPYAGLDYFSKTQKKVLGALWEICHWNDFPWEAICDLHLKDHSVRCWAQKAFLPTDCSTLVQRLLALIASSPQNHHSDRLFSPISQWLKIPHRRKLN